MVDRDLKLVSIKMEPFQYIEPRTRQITMNKSLLAKMQETPQANYATSVMGILAAQIGCGGSLVNN